MKYDPAIFVRCMITACLIKQSKKLHQAHDDLLRYQLMTQLLISRKKYQMKNLEDAVTTMRMINIQKMIKVMAIPAQVGRSPIPLTHQKIKGTTKVDSLIER